MQIAKFEATKSKARLDGVSNLLGALGNLAGASKSNAMFSARLAQSKAIIDTYSGANLALASSPPPMNYLAAATVIANGMANVMQIQSQLTDMQSQNVKKAALGADFITSGSQMMMVGEGSGPERVQVTPLSDPNVFGPQGENNITVNISGNVLSQDYVEGELAEAIREATRRGVEFN